MIKKSLTVFFKIISLIAVINPVSLLASKEIFEQIDIENIPRSAFSSITFWRCLEGTCEVAALLGTHKENLEHWDLACKIPSEHGNLYIYKAASHKDLYETDSFKKTLDDFSGIFQNTPDCYFEIRQMLKKSWSLSKQFYNLCSLSILHDEILLADNVIFAIGAGISTPLISDLTSGLARFELVQIPGTDLATAKSYGFFAQKLINKNAFRASFLKDMASFNNACWRQDKSPTKAHHALSKTINILKERGKIIHVYSSNIDGLEKEAGIELSEETNEGDDVCSIMPDVCTLMDKKSVVISLGKSNDHGSDLSRLYEILQDAKQDTTSCFFNLNLTCAPIIGYKNSHQNILSPDQLFMIPMRCVQGNLQDLLPSLEEMIS